MINKKYLIPFLFLFALCADPAWAQDSFEEWKKKQMQEFQEFRDARDKEFMKMLNDTWKAINSTRAKDFYEEPKPVYIPKIERPSARLDKPKDDPIIEDITLPDVNIDLDSERPLTLPKATAAVEGYRESTIDFYALPVPYAYPQEFDIDLGFSVNKESISSFWGKLSTAKYEPILEQSLKVKNQLALNDWGYALVLYKMGQDIYGNRANESVLFTWFMMTKAGYQAKVGYDQEGVYLLLPTRNQVFNTKFFQIDGLKHYALMLDNTARVPSSIFTYDGSYPNANKQMDLNIHSSPKVQRSLLDKKFKFTYNGETYEVPVKVNRNVIAFYKLYPLTDLDIYFGASVSPEAKSSLINALAPLVKGKSETESVNMILRFVQTAFQYQTDQEQFGYEKYLLPEETLFYPYSDCDDRTIMFATLVKELIGLDVVGVRYPRHLATAVKFTKAPEGDYVMVKGERYTIADPTYINADIGMTMPQYKNQKPEVLAIK